MGCAWFRDHRDRGQIAATGLRVQSAFDRETMGNRRDEFPDSTGLWIVGKGPGPNQPNVGFFSARCGVL